MPRRRLILTLICTLLLVRVGYLLFTIDWPPGYDARSYLAAAQALAQGYSPYDVATWHLIEFPVSASKYLYPPLLAFLLLPLTGFAILPATYICIVLAALTAMWLAIELHHLLGWQLALIAVLLFPATWHTVYLGQINLLVAGLLVVAIRSYRRGQEHRLGAALAFATILKIMPFLTYFALFLRGYRRSVVAWSTVFGLSIVVTLRFASIQTWTEGFLAALKQRWLAPDFCSWTGLLAYWWPGYGEVLGVILTVAILSITVLRLRRLPLAMAVAASIIAPLLVARIIWAHHAVMALPALALLWEESPEKRSLSASTWLLIGLFGGLFTPVMLTLCWSACCWPEHRVLRQLRTYTVPWQIS